MKEILKNSVNSSLKELGIIKNQFQMIHSGRNSLSWKIKNDKETYFLKKYITKTGDIRDRLATEKGFLNLLKTQNIENIPKIICFSREYNWIVLSWIKGNPISDPNYQDWEDLLDFLARVQQIQKKDISFEIKNASESFFDIFSHAKFIQFRIKDLLQNLDDNNPSLSLISNWIEEKLLKIINNYLHERIYNIEEISCRKNSAILSQSDIGFHNTMRFKGKLYFFDFEYAGWDDPYKQYTDLVIQPENLLNYDQATSLLNKFAKILNKKIDLDILLEYIFIYRLKWTIIILKQLLNNNISKYDKDQIFLKAESYYKLVGSLWLME
tara:strand:+ start:857 stop:1831 length:975 start_codon:yes stop_codon:yes gene_type:complete